MQNAKCKVQNADGRVPSLRPILFNTEMVQAILEGRKTATRRVIRNRGKIAQFGQNEPLERPPYEVGDVLWVRETWGDYRECDPDGEGRWYLYRADYPDGADTYENQNGTVFDLPQWHPSIHMPKDAARIFLRVTEVFPERLRESIDEAGVPMWELRAEGIPIYERCKDCIVDGMENRDCRRCDLYDQPRWEFSRLWDRTVRKDRLADEGWAADPWVWVIRFERCERPEGWPE